MPTPTPPHRPQVRVLWNWSAGWPRGVSHTIDCSTASGLEDSPDSPLKDGYRQMDAADIPPWTPRCTKCGGGR